MARGALRRSNKAVAAPSRAPCRAAQILCICRQIRQVLTKGDCGEIEERAATRGTAIAVRRCCDFPPGEANDAYRSQDSAGVGCGVLSGATCGARPGCDDQDGGPQAHPLDRAALL